MEDVQFLPVALKNVLVGASGWQCERLHIFEPFDPVNRRVFRLSCFSFLSIGPRCA